MKVAFKKSFLKELQKLRNKGLKNSIAESIVQVESAHSITQIRNIKKLTGFDVYTDGRLQINNVVRNKDKASLLAWLRSPNTEKQVYAVDGLWQLNKLGIHHSKKELAMINFVKGKKGSLYVCSGCIHFHDKISDVTKEFKF